MVARLLHDRRRREERGIVKQIGIFPVENNSKIHAFCALISFPVGGNDCSAFIVFGRFRMSEFTFGLRVFKVRI